MYIYIHSLYINQLLIFPSFRVNTKLRWIQQFVVNGVVWSQLVGLVIVLLLRGWSGIWVNMTLPHFSLELETPTEWLRIQNLLTPIDLLYGRLKCANIFVSPIISCKLNTSFCTGVFQLSLKAILGFCHQKLYFFQNSSKYCQLWWFCLLCFQ